MGLKWLRHGPRDVDMILENRAGISDEEDAVTEDDDIRVPSSEPAGKVFLRALEPNIKIRTGEGTVVVNQGARIVVSKIPNVVAMRSAKPGYIKMGSVKRMLGAKDAKEILQKIEASDRRQSESLRVLGLPPRRIH